MITVPFYIYRLFPKILPSDETLVAEFNGENNQTMQNLCNQLKSTFRLPRHCWCNLNSLNECLNDLDWLNFINYHLYITNYDYFLKGENIDTKYYVLEVLNSTSNEWANVPNHEGEENYRQKAIFNIYIQDCTRVRRDLESFNLPYEII